ncbi:hypothetical protein [Pseudomonas fluorescens]|uniref:hypothetical protein n=1 Tax=Pseudomonas fluorescens TaxID=294 RepID=UPI0030DB05C9
MHDRRLVLSDLSTYRFAVFCCASKMDLSNGPDPAIALFVDAGMALRYGASMWPTTFEVINLVTGEPVCA